jgi:excinuclease ABC subunit A
MNDLSATLTHPVTDISKPLGCSHKKEDSPNPESLSGNFIHVEEAFTHNLKGISLRIPKHKLVVFTGISGSGKSSLAFDTLYNEAQRRYLNTLSDYAQQFMGRQEKAPVRRISGLAPAIAIEQKTTLYSPRSTVGTVTGVMDYLRVLFARAGRPHCPNCGENVQPQSAHQILEQLNRLAEGTRIQVLSPIIRGRKGDYGALFEQLRREGYSRAYVNGNMLHLDELADDFKLERYKMHHIDAGIDRVVLRQGNPLVQKRLANALQKALERSNGYVRLLLHLPKGDEQEWLRSIYMACHMCQLDFGEMAPRLFSFNSPYGACETCHGTGDQLTINEDALVKDASLSLRDGAMPSLTFLLWGKQKRVLTAMEKHLGLPMGKPWKSWKLEQRALFLYGKAGETETFNPAPALNYDETPEDWEAFFEHYEGVLPLLRLKASTGSLSEQYYYRRFMNEDTCRACHGHRLKPFALNVTLGERLSLKTLQHMELDDALESLIDIEMQMTEMESTIAETPLKEVRKRLKFLLDVGVNYLSLGRSAATLSGGEAQRIRLASQLGSGLSGVMYVLDEPSIGLHAHNNQQLIDTLKELRDKGNTVLVVEHDEELIRQADWVVDIGPGAGREGGELLYVGPPAELQQVAASQTGAYLKGKREIPFNRDTLHPLLEALQTPSLKVKPKCNKKRTTSETTVFSKALIEETSPATLQLKGCTRHNLTNLDIILPLKQMVTLTGMSGSGKSTLLFECLLPYLSQYMQATQGSYGRKKAIPLADLNLTLPPGVSAIEGIEQVDKLVVVDQSPIGRTSRSNPATYTGLFDPIRNLYANTLEAKSLGLTASHFSFNVKGGRCETCKGAGKIKISVGMLPEAEVQCQACEGRRYTAETLRVQYQGKNIYELLETPIRDAVALFESHPTLPGNLQLLCDVGLGYLALGQGAPLLSGGEAQRLKLATDLMRKPTGHTVYIFDEPSIGLHWHDLHLFVDVVKRLVANGHTVLTIEHQLDYIAASDWVIDLGPEGGTRGGQLIVQGPPAVVAQCPESLTGQYLKRHMGG